MGYWLNYITAVQSILLTGFCYITLPVLVLGQLRPRPVWVQDVIIVLNFTYCFYGLFQLLSLVFFLYNRIGGGPMFGGTIPILWFVLFQLMNVLLCVSFLWPHYRHSLGLTFLGLFLAQWFNLYLWLRGSGFTFEVVSWGYFPELPTRAVAVLVYLLVFGLCWVFLYRNGWLTRALQEKHRRQELDGLLGEEEDPNFGPASEKNESLR